MRSYPLEQIQDKKILVIGDLILDRYWFGDVSRISPEAPVPVVRVVKKEDRLGGAGNVARNVISLGAQATLTGIVGVDEGGEKIQRLADEVGINTALSLDQQINTTLKMRILGRKQQMLRVDFEHEPTEHSLKDLYANLEELIPAHDIVVLSDYAKGVLKHVDSIINVAKQHGLQVLVDPKGDNYQAYMHANLLTPNQLEMSQAVGPWNTEEELYEKAQMLREQLQLEALLVTRSEKGMTLFSDDGAHHVNAQAQEVFDVSGAGDTVLATMAVTRAAGVPWPEAIKWANKAGGIVVGKVGTSIVSAEELL
ncbi:Bifunctional protein hldE [Oligella ureolytica]|uniref:Bifunctional protein hldE n=1 Tax=Oligella ureolytica TaxID=90244 RepID=A0A378XK49_9BURK|nr:D-glycero-beta-D-manno-heptose-7-phosphate kinase [Oligella ureolytica]NLP32551.1 D-glycero-beta-D-manno-heptose-7-phosphate kinase [Oligella ureolytica]QPT39925.1 D-glycero-beta-D-manno-heptose-7-phosphate kinase [Oligella ureolytica]SUA58012.1 Bifunctional protein hldE [Oligella ureolytica]